MLLTVIEKVENGCLNKATNSTKTNKQTRETET